MPIYEFKCESCEGTFELFVLSSKEAESVRCSYCNSPEVKKLMSVTNTCSTTPKKGSTGSYTPQLKHRQCGTGSCSSFTLPGHER